MSVLELERIEDARGSFAPPSTGPRSREPGLEPLVEQCDLSYDHVAGTLRGIHEPVVTEATLVRCTAGAIVDQIVDVLRQEQDIRWAPARV